MFTLSGTINMPNDEEINFNIKQSLGSVGAVEDAIDNCIDHYPAATSFVFVVTRQPPETSR